MFGDNKTNANPNGATLSNTRILQDIAGGVLKGFFIGTVPYHLAYSLATKIQTGMPLHWDKVLRFAPLTGLRTASREFYRAPIRNETRSILENNTSLPPMQREFFAGVAAAFVDAILMNPLEYLRIQGSVRNQKALDILRRECWPPSSRSARIIYHGLGSYMARNMLIWPVLLPAGKAVEDKLQARHPEKPLSWTELSFAAFIAGNAAALVSNPFELKRQMKQAGMAWNGYFALLHEHYRQEFQPQPVQQNAEANLRMQRLKSYIQTPTILYEDCFRAHQQLKYLQREMLGPSARTMMFRGFGASLRVLLAGAGIRGTQYIITYFLNIATRRKNPPNLPTKSTDAKRTSP